MPLRFSAQLLLLSGLLAITGCVRIPIADTHLNYQQLCSGERNKCYADGDFQYVIKQNRPPVPRSEWARYLGKLIREGEPRSTPLNCALPSAKDFDEVFSRQLDVTLVKDVELAGDIKAAIEAELPTALDNRAKIVTDLQFDIVHKVHENAFAKAEYKVITLSGDFINSVLNAAEGTPLFECKSKLVSQGTDHFFVKSIAAITSEGAMNQVQLDEIGAAIGARLENATINGGPVSAEVKADLALKISSRTEKAISAKTAAHSTVYSLGFWNHRLAAARLEQFIAGAELQEPQREKEGGSFELLVPPTR